MAPMNAVRQLEKCIKNNKKFEIKNMVENITFEDIKHNPYLIRHVKRPTSEMCLYVLGVDEKFKKYINQECSKEI